MGIRRGGRGAGGRLGLAPGSCGGGDEGGRGRAGRRRRRRAREPPSAAAAAAASRPPPWRTRTPRPWRKCWLISASTRAPASAWSKSRSSGRGGEPTVRWGRQGGSQVSVCLSFLEKTLPLEKGRCFGESFSDPPPPFPNNNDSSFLISILGLFEPLQTRGHAGKGGKKKAGICFRTRNKRRVGGGRERRRWLTRNPPRGFPACPGLLGPFQHASCQLGFLLSPPHLSGGFYYRKGRGDFSLSFTPFMGFFASLFDLLFPLCFPSGSWSLPEVGFLCPI